MLISFLIFSLVATFSPGPNNLASMSSGLQNGYRKTLNFLCGISIGVFTVFLTLGFFSSWMLNLSKTSLLIAKVIGALYMFYLALIPFFTLKSKKSKPISYYNFYSGFLAQVLNLKLLLNTVIAFSCFNELIGSSPSDILIASFGLSLGCFLAISLWTLLGTMAKTKLKSQKQYILLQTLLSVSIFYVGCSLFFL